MIASSIKVAEEEHDLSSARVILIGKPEHDRDLYHRDRGRGPRARQPRVAMSWQRTFGVTLDGSQTRLTVDGGRVRQGAKSYTERSSAVFSATGIPRHVWLNAGGRGRWRNRTRMG